MTDRTNSLELDVTRRLLESWDSHGPRPTIGTRSRPVPPDQLALIYPFVTHTHRLARTSLGLIDAGQAFESVPMVRAAYECAVTAMWVRQADDGAAALMRKFINSRKSLRESIQRSSMGKDHGDLVVSHADDPLPDSTSGYSFENLCTDFAGGVDLYLIYRVLSSYSHPGVALADLHLEEDESQSRGFTLMKEPPLDNLGSTTIPIAISRSVLWAGRAFDFLVTGRPRRSELRDAGKELGIPSKLTLTPEAQARIATGARH